jgi:hypothetical protein
VLIEHDGKICLARAVQFPLAFSLHHVSPKGVRLSGDVERRRRSIRELRRLQEGTLGQRQDNLSWLLANAGYSVELTERLCLRRQDIKTANLAKEVKRIYKQLDGVLDDFPNNIGQWDLRVGAVAIELDEERHFNRYRLRTLKSTVYSKLPRFPLSSYRSYCDQRERECLATASHGGYWSNLSCIRQFGPKSPEGELTPPGSPRWKQRAFYDFLKDLSPIICSTWLARVSIWDNVTVDGTNLLVNQVLLSRSLDAVPGLVALIGQRAGVGLLLSR